MLTKGCFSYDHADRSNQRCHVRKRSYDRDDFMRTLHRRSLMPVAIELIAIAWIARVLSRRLVADRADRERFYENYFLTERRSKRSKLSHGASISCINEYALRPTRWLKQDGFFRRCSWKKSKKTSVYTTSFLRTIK